MSIYYVKSVKFDKENGKIFVTAADSSCRPRSYFRSEYASEISDFKEKCKQFWVSVLDGNMQFLKSCRWSEETEKAFEVIRRIEKEITPIVGDMCYHTSFWSELKAYVATTYLVPLVTKEDVVADEAFESEFAEKCLKKWREIEKQRADKGQITILSALKSSIFPGKVVLQCEKENRLIVAEEKKYHLGILENADHTAIILPEGSGDDWNMVACGTASNLAEILAKYPQLTNAVNTHEQTVRLRYYECYEGYYDVQASSLEEAMETLREDMRNGKVDGPDECYASGCTTVEMEDVVRRYAEYQYNNVRLNEYLGKNETAVKTYCDRVVQRFVDGLITVNEAMKLLNDTVKNVSANTTERI